MRNYINIIKHSLNLSIPLIIFLVLFTIPSWAFNITEFCEKEVIKLEGSLDSIKIGNEEDFPWLVMKRKGLEEVEIRPVDFGVAFFDEVYISYKDNHIIHCWPPFTYPEAILVEKYDYYFHPIQNRQETVIKVHFLLRINCGLPCTNSKIESFYFFEDGFIDFYEVLQGTVHEFPSPWFMGYLTFKEAYKFAKYHDLGIFEWNGKLYTVD